MTLSFSEKYKNGEPNFFIEKIWLRKNDGFTSVKQFFEGFSEDFEGQIIHFTDFRY